MKDYNPDILFLIETKSPRNRMARLLLHFGLTNVFTIYIVGSCGGLALYWKSEIGLEIQNYSHII